MATRCMYLYEERYIPSGRRQGIHVLYVSYRSERECKLASSSQVPKMLVYMKMNNGISLPHTVKAVHKD